MFPGVKKLVSLIATTLIVRAMGRHSPLRPGCPSILVFKLVVEINFGKTLVEKNQRLSVVEFSLNLKSRGLILPQLTSLNSVRGTSSLLLGMNGILERVQAVRFQTL